MTTTFAPKAYQDQTISLSPENGEKFYKACQEVSGFIKLAGINVLAEDITKMQLNQRGDLSTINLQLRDGKNITIYITSKGNVTIISPEKTITYDPKEGAMYFQKSKV